MRVLQIEGDGATVQSVELMLKTEKIAVYSTDLGEEGVDLAKVYDYDLILLSGELGDMSGMDVLRQIRAAGDRTPIVYMTGRDAIATQVKALELGADDYLPKPFHRDVLVARIHAIVRRSKGHATSMIQAGPVRVDLERKRSFVGDVEVNLTPKEQSILELLAIRAGDTVSREMMMNHLYGGMDEPELKIVDVFICKLRKKLRAAGAGHPINVVWGRGYTLEAQAEQKEAA